MSEGQNQQQEGRQLFCRVITPERVIYDGEANMVIARIADGDIGVLVDHQPIVSTVEIGTVQINQDDERHVFATSDGFFKVSENLVQILVEEAVPVDEIDVDEADSRVEEAENELSEVSDDEDDEGEGERQRNEIERRRKIGENLARVAREHGEG